MGNFPSFDLAIFGKDLRILVLFFFFVGFLRVSWTRRCSGIFTYLLAPPEWNLLFCSPNMGTGQIYDFLSEYDTPTSWDLVVLRESFPTQKHQRKRDQFGGAKFSFSDFRLCATSSQRTPEYEFIGNCVFSLSVLTACCNLVPGSGFEPPHVQPSFFSCFVTGKLGVWFLTIYFSRSRCGTALAMANPVWLHGKRSFLSKHNHLGSRPRTLRRGIEPGPNLLWHSATGKFRHFPKNQKTGCSMSIPCPFSKPMVWIDRTRRSRDRT